MKDDEWSDDSGESCSDSSDEVMESTDKHKKKNKALNPKQNSVGLSKKMLQQQKAKDFFKDM
jgi:hypothetical protein